MRDALIRLFDKGLEKKQIADPAGIHPSNISRIARGQQRATHETWVALHLAHPSDIPPPLGYSPPDVAGMFHDRARAIRIIQNLVEIERVSADRFELLERLTQIRHGNRH